MINKHFTAEEEKKFTAEWRLAKKLILPDVTSSIVRLPPSPPMVSTMPTVSTCPCSKISPTLSYKGLNIVSWARLKQLICWARLKKLIWSCTVTKTSTQLASAQLHSRALPSLLTDITFFQAAPMVMSMMAYVWPAMNTGQLPSLADQIFS